MIQTLEYPVPAITDKLKITDEFKLGFEVKFLSNVKKYFGFLKFHSHVLSIANK